MVKVGEGSALPGPAINCTINNSLNVNNKAARLLIWVMSVYSRQVVLSSSLPGLWSVCHWVKSDHHFQ